MERIFADSLKKKTNEFQILKSIDITVDEKEICALIGPNGAGKTTVLNCLLGLVFYDEGNIKINGISFSKGCSCRQVLRQIGIVMQYPNSISNMTVEELFQDHFYYLNLQNNEPLYSILEAVGLNVTLDSKIGKMSLGMKQRLLFALAISHKPNILILDEPFNGLDPDGIRLVQKIIIAFKENGGSVLIASHSLGELEDVSDSVVFIKNGETSNKSTMKELFLKYPGGLREYYCKIRGRENVCSD